MSYIFLCVGDIPPLDVFPAQRLSDVLLRGRALTYPLVGTDDAPVACMHPRYFYALASVNRTSSWLPCEGAIPLWIQCHYRSVAIVPFVEYVPSPDAPLSTYLNAYAEQQRSNGAWLSKGRDASASYAGKVHRVLTRIGKHLIRHSGVTAPRISWRPVHVDRRVAKPMIILLAQLGAQLTHTYAGMAPQVGWRPVHAGLGVPTPETVTWPL